MLWLKELDIFMLNWNPGDVYLLFHSNILYIVSTGSYETSDKPRWSLISCYNSLSNPAYNDESISWKEPVKILPDEAIDECRKRGSASQQGDFLKKEKDPALKETGLGERSSYSVIYNSTCIASTSSSQNCLRLLKSSDESVV